MKVSTLFIGMLCTWIQVLSQSKYFEGDLVYHVSVKSRVVELSDKDAFKVLALGETLRVTCKNGNYRRSSELHDEYHIIKDQKVYIKFRKLDTLYYLDYPYDTAKVIDITKSDSVFNIAGYNCKVITIRTSVSNSRLYYTSALLNDPVYVRMNTMGKFSAFFRETGGAVYLWHREEYPLATETDSCIRVEAKSIDDHIFDLPALPQKKFSVKSLTSTAGYSGGEERWVKYLQANLDSKVAAKYLKLPKGQDQAIQKVYVEFVVSETGMISDIHVANKDEVHPKLAEEAMRVIRESPRWTPAVFYGEKITTTVKQPIIFTVVKG